MTQQVHLVQDGLLGRGATALVFKCVWPSRHGRTLLAAKVLKVGRILTALTPTWCNMH
jgi:CHASE1-domain containing sensor protein